jgi:hypothetical protein
MRKVLTIIAVCSVAAISLTIFGQGRDLQPMMKEIQPTSGAITTGMQNRAMSKEDVVKNADKLQGLFKEVSAFMQGKNITDAVGFANDAANAAAELSKAAKANDADAMFAAQKTITKQCATCHAAHREQLPDKTFKLKSN